MKILVYGCGVIGSYLIHKLCEAGNDVTVVSRGKWKEVLDAKGLQIRHKLSGKETLDHPKVIGTVPENMYYDMVFSVKCLFYLRNMSQAHAFKGQTAPCVDLRHVHLVAPVMFIGWLLLQEFVVEKSKAVDQLIDSVPLSHPIPAIFPEKTAAFQFFQPRCEIARICRSCCFQKLFMGHSGFLFS